MTNLFIYLSIYEGSLTCVVANILQCDIVVSESELQSSCYVHFRINILGKGMNAPIPH